MASLQRQRGYRGHGGLRMSRVVDLSYDKRRFVAIGEPPPAASPNGNSREMTKAVVRGSTGVLSFIFPRITDAVVDFVAGPDSTAASATSPFLYLPAETAASELTFGPGHPVRGCLYVGHPLISTRYLPFAAFHRFLFEEKVNELVTLLASLGATRVRVIYEKGYQSCAALGADVAFAGKKVGAKAERNTAQRQQAFFEETYRPSGPPCLPSNPIWFGHEASWQAVAQRRLSFRTEAFRAVLNYEEDYGVSASVKASVANTGVNLGGNFQDFESTCWRFEGEFA